MATPQWKFRAPLAILDESTLDGRILARPPHGEARQWVKQLPLPVLARTTIDRNRDHSPPPHHLVAHIDHIDLRDDGTLTAYGTYGNDDLSIHYARAMAIDAVQLAVETDDNIPTPADTPDATVTFTNWRILGAMLVRDNAWPDHLIEPATVWRETPQCNT